MEKKRNLNLVLQVLQEEAAEVIQVASKIVRFGRNSYNPLLGDETLTNTELLHQEIGDFLAMLEVLEYDTDFEFDYNKIVEAKNKKVKKLLTYLPFEN